jgi:cyclophilin family peptidyl-prolyl cis-trans isomerase
MARPRGSDHDSLTGHHAARPQGPARVGRNALEGAGRQTLAEDAMNQGRSMLSLAIVAGLAALGLFLLAAPDEAQAQGAAANPQVVLETNQGPITIELDQAKAPITVANFLKYVDSGHYNGTIFHRVIPGFMIQGGGFSEAMREKDTGGNIKNEAGNGLKNMRGTLAMARTPDPHSASAQFFINLSDNDFLNYKSATPQGFGYAVFGKVVDGMDVVDKIATVKTGNKGMHENVPVQPVVITAAKRK